MRRALTQVLGMESLGSEKRRLTREVYEWPRCGREVADDGVPPDSDAS
ncbi:MAG: hypothetical protein P8188_09815 [Gemmatimonadota bacterium]